jgi:hypothetical protein
MAFDLGGLGREEADPEVECQYGKWRYRCRAVRAPGGNHRRLIVEIPDLDRGAQVTVRFSTDRGSVERRVTIANPPQILHEIESLALPDGGRSATGPDGARHAVSTLRTWQTTSTPGITALMPYLPEECDAVYAKWGSASATDPVFASEFGPLEGALAPLRPVTADSPVNETNLPQWLVTYSLSATRLQFIAHYEVRYRVGICGDRVIR